MSVTLTWSGDTSNRISILDSYYKVTDRVFTKDEMVGCVIGNSNGDVGDGVAQVEIDNYFELYGVTDVVSGVITAKAGTYDLGGTEIVVPEDGTYFMINLGVVTNSLTLPNAEEIKTPLAEITYNGETIAQLNAGDKATIPCSQYTMSKDLVVKVNGGNCSGEHIIEVDALPAVGEEGAIYKVKVPFSDVVVVMNDWNVKMVLGDENELYCYTVPTKPTENIQVTDMNGNSTPIHCYYVEDENDLFVYCDNDGDGTPEWVSFTELGFGTFQGTISNANEATADGYYAIGGGIVYYQYINGDFELMVYESSITSEEKTVTPTTATQEVTPTNADYLSKVTVTPIPSNYIVPSGTLNIDKNGTRDVTNYASAKVEVRGALIVETVDDLPTDALVGSMAIVLGGE